MATPVLHYFDLLGRGESIRLLFTHSHTPFTDHRVSYEDWGQLKTSHFSEFDQLPRLDIDGLELIQSRAILRYIAKKYGYIPADPALQYQIDSLIALIDDFTNAVFPLITKKDEEGENKWHADNAARFLHYFEARLERNNEGQGWFIGNTVTLADLEAFEFVWDMFLRPARVKYSHYLDSAPKLKAHFERLLASSPELKAYHETREDKWI